MKVTGQGGTTVLRQVIAHRGNLKRAALAGVAGAAGMALLQEPDAINDLTLEGFKAISRPVGQVAKQVAKSAVGVIASSAAGDANCYPPDAVVWNKKSGNSICMIAMHWVQPFTTTWDILPCPYSPPSRHPYGYLALSACCNVNTSNTQIGSSV